MQTETIIEAPKEVQQPRQYVNLNTVFPTSRIDCETYYIEPITLTKQQVQFEYIRNMRSLWLVEGLKSDFQYMRLVKKGKLKFFDQTMMSDTPMERNTNEMFIRKANGDVLIFGLGLGLIIMPLLTCDDVKSITVVELYSDLIELVTPYLKKHDHENKLTIVQGDAHSYTHNIAKNKKFDTIYFDIWLSICMDNYEEQTHLHKKYCRFINRDNKKFVLDSWMNSYYKKALRKERRSC